MNKGLEKSILGSARPPPPRPAGTASGTTRSDLRSPVTKNTILLGLLLTILGTGTYALVGFLPERWTALVPAFFGVGFLGMGLVAQRRPAWRRPVVMGATALALVAFVGTAPGLVQALSVLVGAEVARPVAAMEQGIMAALCLGYIGRAAVCYADARRLRASAVRVRN